MKKVKLLRPCGSFEGFLAECNIEINLPFDILCSTLKTYGIKNLKFSQELGIMKFSFRNKRMMIFRNKKIRINNMRNREDARIMIMKLKKIISETIIL